MRISTITQSGVLVSTVVLFAALSIWSTPAAHAADLLVERAVGSLRWQNVASWPQVLWRIRSRRVWPESLRSPVPGNVCWLNKAVQVKMK